MHWLPHRRDRSRILHRGIAWALIPLALWGGRPVSGCICQDGHFEVVCKAPICAGDAHAFLKGDVSRGETESRSCCRKAGNREAETAKSCCSKNPAPQAPSDGIASTSDRGCQPADHPDILLSRPVQLECDVQIETVAVISADLSARRATHVVELLDSGGCTAAERVVVLGRLLL